jgi:hypothetical protein
MMDRSRFESAWSTWTDRQAPPPAELVAFVETLRDEADRAVAAAPFGSARADAIAWQIRLTVALCRMRGSPTRDFASCTVLTALTQAATGEARAELLALTVSAAGGPRRIPSECYLDLAPMLAPDTARAWIREALAEPDLDHYDQGRLLRLLPPEDLDELLPPLIERAVAITDSEERWSMLYALVDDLPELWRRQASEASRARYGVELLRIARGYDIADGYEDAAEQALAEVERQHWGAPLTAWRVGDEARKLPPDQRARLLDRALDEFAAIALTPVNPGNDEGPFWAIAHLLDEQRVRRALEIVARMDAADWKGDLDASRAALLSQLALSGHADEAELHIERIVGPFCAHWRGCAWGGILGARMVLDPAARFETLFVRALRDPMNENPELRFHLLGYVLIALEDCAPPDADNVEALIALAQTFSLESRLGALEDLMGQFTRVLSPERWLDLALTEPQEPHRLQLLRALALALHEEKLDPTPALAPWLAVVKQPPFTDPIYTLRDMRDLRAWIAPDDAIARWTDLLHFMADSYHYTVNSVLEELPAALLWLAGPEALLTVGRTMAEVLRAP